MKAVTVDASAFATSLSTFLGGLVGAHPESELLLAGIEDGTITMRVVIDQSQDNLSVGALMPGGEVRLVGGIDMSGGSSAWRVVYPDWTSPPDPDEAVN